MALFDNSLEISHALERIMSQVIGMRRADDVSQLVETLWNELERLGFSFRSCSLTEIDQKRDWLTSYNIWNSKDLKQLHDKDSRIQPLGANLVVFISHTSLTNLPSRYEKAYQAWKNGTVESHVLTLEEIKELISLNKDRYGGKLTAENYDLRHYLHIPFEFGVFTLRTTNVTQFQLSEGELDFLSRAMKIVSSGYSRYKDFLKLERERDLQQMSAEVQAMRKADDIIPVMGLIWEGIQKAEIPLTYMSITVRNAAEDYVRFYSIWNNNYKYFELFNKIAIKHPSFSTNSKILLRHIPLDMWEKYSSNFSGFHFISKEEAPAYRQKIGQLWETKFDEDVTDEQTSLIAAPFPNGRIVLGQVDTVEHKAKRAFTASDLELIEEYSKALTLGFARSFDFETLERQNRILKEERALDRVKVEVLRMQHSRDVTRIAKMVWDELNELGYPIEGCRIAFANEAANTIVLHSINRGMQYEVIKKVPHVVVEDGAVIVSHLEAPLREEGGSPLRPTAIKAWKEGKVHFDRIVGAERKKQIAEITKRVIGVKVKPETIPDQYATYIPFEHGWFSFYSIGSDKKNYTEAEIALFTRFGEAFADGYARFRELQQREIESAASRIRAQVTAMKRSSDIVEVVQELAHQYQNFGLEFTACSIAVIDDAADLVRLYAISALSMPDTVLLNPSILECDRSIIDTLSDRTESLIVRDFAPGYHFLYTTEPLEGSPTLEERNKPVRIITRSDQDRLDELPRYRKRWSEAVEAEHIPRYVLRGPFEGGSMALSSSHPLQSRDRELLEAFTEAVSLGFNRFVEFRRLEDQNKILKAASRLKSEFLANISHELKTPMNSILNFSSLVVDGVCGKVSADALDAVGEINRNGRNLNLLINDLLELSKIEAGAITLTCDECSPDSLVETAVSLVRHFADAKGLEIIEEIPENLPLVWADERRITQQVLVNLLKNAIKFTGNGAIRVKVHSNESNVVFQVSDDGIGIPDTDLERIFETFHQVDGSSSKNAEGTGLGLAIARSFVELHGGTIKAESVVNVGSTFTFTLPSQK